MKEGIGAVSSRPRVQGGWSTRQLRAAVLVVAVLLVAVFFVLRKPEPQPPGPTATEPTAPKEAVALEPAPTGEADQAPAEEQAVKRSAYQLDQSTATDVESALAAGDEALARGHIFEPAADNALQHYLAALEMDPDNESAREGLDAVVARLVRDMEQALDRHDVEAAETLARVLETAFPEEPAIPTLTERLTTMERADRLIASAQADIEAGRLVEPPGRNAMERLSQVELTDPDNPALGMTQRQARERLVEKALAAARQENFDSALSMIDRAIAIRGRSAVLVDAREQIVEYQNARIAEESAVARAAMAEARFADAQRAMVRARELGAGEEALDALASELAHARIYGPFSAGEIFADPLPGGGTGPDMVVIPRGSFLMGAVSGDARSAEQPRHRVRFDRGFALGLKEVSVGDFSAFVDATDYRTDADRRGYSFVYNETNGRIIRRQGVTWRDDFKGRPAEPDLPVLHVSWDDAAAYARWLRQATGQPYRLPTEAEFEFAIRAGGYDPYWWGAGSPDRVVENLTGSQDVSPRYNRRWNQAFAGYADGHWGPAPVGSFIANPYGVFDMAGNVAEWVADCWHDSYVRAPTDGRAWVNPGCERRVVRAAFWGGDPTTARSAYRTSYPTEQRGAAIGLRVARDLFVAPD